MVHVNLILWLLMFGAAFVPVPDQGTKWIAAAGLIVAALWEHATVRGFLRSRRKNETCSPTAG